MSTVPPPPPADARGRLPRPITADEFARMVAAGVLDDVRHVELWDGCLVQRPSAWSWRSSTPSRTTTSARSRPPAA